ncbi:MAG: prepilin-type N-terminal cleavage/methylation domain-containing protein [Candidatus Moraniibacteriota bacterium]|nr:MAG: prepilin-type N-terminal cleavage/methylation domain-containing protein [Candidatus Moranbacteria bacterium]
MKKEWLLNRKGFSVVEAVVATAIFSIIVASIMTSIFSTNRIVFFSGEKSRATFLAEEGLEATKSIRDKDFENLIDGTYGLDTQGGEWIFSGSQDIQDIFTRSITISSLNENTKKVQSTIQWTQDSEEKIVTLESRLTNWKISKMQTNRGMLVFGDGGTTSDSIKYRMYEEESGTWGSVASLADIDQTTTNKALRTARVYASEDRDEYIAISRHFNGTQQSIYAQVYNGSSWGNVQLLSSWNANTFLYAQNYDGVYLSNGDFVVIYSDFTNTPKFRVWNGTSWGVQVSMKTASTYPNFVVAKARPETKEIMVAFTGQNRRVFTQYFNGGSYTTTSWTYLQHTTSGVANTVRLADFSWSPENTSVGAMVYSEGTTRYISVKVFTANGSGGGAWSSRVNSPTQSNSSMNVMIQGREGANQFMTCYKDNKNPQQFLCFEVNSFTPTIATPTNNIITTTAVSATGVFGLDFNYAPNGLSGVVVYSDNTAIPKMRTYNPSSHIFSSAISLPSLGNTVYTNKIIVNPDSEEAMFLFGGSNRSLYSIAFDSVSGTVYTTPAGKALNTQGTNGSANTDQWYDFVWKK